MPTYGGMRVREIQVTHTSDAFPHKTWQTNARLPEARRHKPFVHPPHQLLLVSPTLTTEHHTREGASGKQPFNARKNVTLFGATEQVPPELIFSNVTG